MALIKVIKCSNPHSWYRNDVGKTFVVDDSILFDRSDTYWGLRGGITIGLLLKDDVKILDSENKIS